MKTLPYIYLVGLVAGSVVPQNVIDINIRLSADQKPSTENDTFNSEIFVDPNRGPGAPIYDPTTRQWSGYLNIPSGRSLFFWYEDMNLSQGPSVY